jgi:hypothetical protein
MVVGGDLRAQGRLMKGDLVHPTDLVRRRFLRPPGVTA